MNTNTIPNPAPTPVADSTPPPVAWIGLDWGHKTHAFALHERAGPAQEGTLPHSAEALHAWLRDLELRCDGRPVALALEASRGAVIHALVQYPWLTIYPINPVTSTRYRNTFTPSGASDDLPDARVLLELARDHTAKLRPLEPQDSQTLELTGLVELRRDTVDRRTQVLNQLTSLLRSDYPQALELVGELDTELAVDFLSRWPDLIALKAAKPGVLKRFYHAHQLRRPELLEARLKLIQNAVALTTETARVRVAVLQLRGLLDPLRAFRKHVALLDAAIKTGFAAHPEAALFRDLPGAGPALAPRLCVAFGTLRTLYSRSGQPAETRRRRPGAGEERPIALDALALAGPNVLAPELCRVGRSDRGVFGVGQTLLRAHEGRRQRPSRHPAGAGLQVDSRPLEVLADPHPLRRSPVSQATGPAQKPKRQPGLSHELCRQKTLRRPPQVLRYSCHDGRLRS